MYRQLPGRLRLRLRLRMKYWDFEQWVSVILLGEYLIIPGRHAPNF